MNEKRIRLDVFLADSGLSSSREKAQRDILSGWVSVNGETVRDSSKKIPVNGAFVEVRRPGGLFVSRGGEKLRRGLDVFGIDPRGMTAADLGASTGGFTDCLIKAGVKKVYAIDVGYGQLDFSLRRDSRVIVLERVNVKSLLKEQFEDEIDFIAMDLSFISVAKVIQHIKELFETAQGIMLIKPQFEALPEEHKKGVVRKEKNHIDILKRTLENLSKAGTLFHGVSYSPLKGPAGNIEFLLHFSFKHRETLPSISLEESAAIAESAVKEAHDKL
ncbi:MAG: TlyA family RNA methyltransferase [Leptospirales bacterium]|nr:TlyA family RNA methyltransferase [Leptospirales bacterium]